MAKWINKTVVPRCGYLSFWGQQVRSYVIGERVKDLRTDIETTDVDAVLDGAIDQFLRPALAMKVHIRKAHDPSLPYKL